MSTEVTHERDSRQPIIRSKTLNARSEGMRTVIDFGEFGQIITDKPAPHGGTGAGPSPFQTVPGALYGCEAVAFARTAAEYGERRGAPGRGRGDGASLPGLQPGHRRRSALLDALVYRTRDARAR
jgi:hypothetical protein